MTSARAIVITVIKSTPTAPPMIAGVLSETGSASSMVLLLSTVGGREHSGWSREEMATEQWGSTVINTPVTLTLTPPLTHSSIREMREPLSVSLVPSSLARYVTNDGDSE